LEQGYGFVATQLESLEFNPLLAGLFLLQDMSSFTLEWTTGHLNFSFFPVDLGVVVLELVVA